MSVFGGNKKPRAMPANIEWNSVERLWYTSGGSMTGAVPPEFDDLDAKLKEMQSNFAALLKLCKKHNKYLTSTLKVFSCLRLDHSQSAMSIAQHLLEMANANKELALYCVYCTFRF